jgi:hypothetical protein
MGVKPELAFDVCWEVYRGAREVLESKRGISALNWKDTGKFLWRPDIRPRLNEWVADFALAGQKALEGPDWASRMVLFRLYYLGLAPYENARHFLALSERSWVNWTGGSAPPLWQRAFTALHVSTEKVFRELAHRIDSGSWSQSRYQLEKVTGR